jgi:MoxR-like ATPase
VTDVVAVASLARRVVDSVEAVIVGKRPQIELVLTAVLGRGHVLLEDVPGTGKTMLARSMAGALGLHFGRIQCTPDLLPNDITGVNVYDPRDASFRFRPGPVFAGIVLADEINRSTPRTQAALLEAMQEEQVTVDGTTHPLPDPFVVFATQNPVEFEGTFPLPEAQLDRFMLSTRLGYPDATEEAGLVARSTSFSRKALAEPVTDQAEVVAAIETIDGVHIEADVAGLIVEAVTRCRGHESVVLGPSTRASMALGAACRARAATDERDYVIPDDVKALAIPVLAHRVVLDADARLRRITPEAVVSSIVSSIRVP